MGEGAFLDHAAELVHRYGLLDRLLAGITDRFAHPTLNEPYLLLALGRGYEQGTSESC